MRKQVVRKALSIFVSVFLFLAYTNAYAGKLFVDASGSGTACKKNNPCPTIQQAVGIASAGDTIKVEAGTYTENIIIPPGKDNLTISGDNGNTIVVSAGGIPGLQAPPGVDVDIIFDIRSPGVTIKHLNTVHPAIETSKRDLGFFVRPPAVNTTIKQCVIERNRTGTLEPTAPGSRGILVFRATGTVISKNAFLGNYEDHVHIPASQTEISQNKIRDATRIGIAIIQESATSFSTGNLVSQNNVSNSGTDGIQIQGDDNDVIRNKVSGSGGAGIKLCGAGDCVAPGTNAVADGNTVIRNKLNNNTGGNIINDGTNNTIK